VKLPVRLRLNRAARARLLAVAAGEREADLAIRGGRILNVFTGEVVAADVGVAEGRIAWIGLEGAPARDAIDADGAILVPGLIDAHGHADILTTPASFAREVVGHGTTAMVTDTFNMLRWLAPCDVRRFLEGQAEATLKFLWAIAPDRTTFTFDEPLRPDPQVVRRLMEELPGVVGSGELTTWPQLLAGEERIERFVEQTVDHGLRVDGHLAGASRRTLERVVAAGVTSDHEAISGPELADRLSLGLWSMVRQSSLRPDAAVIGEFLAESDLPLNRVLVTTDGTDPEDLLEGHLDAAVRVLIAAGLKPVEAVRMATINPATYLGLDAHLGSVTPGRCADLVAIETLEEFRPRMVIADGRPVTPETVSGGSAPWQSLRLRFRRADLGPAALMEICERGPVLRLSSVIARPAPEHELRTEPWHYAALIRRDGSAVTGARILGLRSGDLASSHTGYRDVLLLGRNPDAMLRAYARVVDVGGGLATPDALLELPVLGACSDQPVTEIAARSREITKSAAWGPDQAPLKWVTLFLTEAVMPGWALTPDGVIDVRAAELTSRAVPVTPVREAMAGGAS
jgi:adenine deaminase